MRTLCDVALIMQVDGNHWARVNDKSFTIFRVTGRVGIQRHDKQTNRDHTYVPTLEDLRAKDWYEVKSLKVFKMVPCEFAEATHFLDEDLGHIIYGRFNDLRVQHYKQVEVT